MDAEAVPPAPVAPTTSLLSLPTELLVRIGHGVAPDGGRKVGALRLTCRRLERAVSHIAWASIFIHPDSDFHNPLIEALLWDLGGRGAQVTSVRWNLPATELKCSGIHAAVLSKLCSLERLHIIGTKEEGRSSPEPLPKAVWSALGAFHHLKDGLILERIGGRHSWSDPSLDKFLPENIGSVSLISCDQGCYLYTNNRAWNTVPVLLRHPVRRLILDGRTTPVTPASSEAAILFIGMALTSAFCCEARFSSALSLAGYVEMVRQWAPVTTIPFPLQKLRLLSLPTLFKYKSPMAPTLSGEEYMLDALSRTPITNLSLPVTNAFHISTTLGAVVMQNVTILTLETDPVAPFVAKPDLYTHGAHPILVTFLSTSFPNLTSLHLRGWFDATGIQGPATATPRILSTQYSLVWSLISALRWTDVVEIRLKSSNGHADGDSECCFTRADKDAPEWTARLAVYI